jgi:hypothetical protein
MPNRRVAAAEKPSLPRHAAAPPVATARIRLAPTGETPLCTLPGDTAPDAHLCPIARCRASCFADVLPAPTVTTPVPRLAVVT